MGRSVPPKAQHELVKALWVYRHLFDAQARLHLVGGIGVERYGQAVRHFAHELGLDEAVEFAGDVNESALAASYREADVFVSLSEHEGFGIPLVEAMASGLPVICFGGGGRAKTVGDAGLVLRTADPMAMAVAVHRLVGDQGLQARLVRAGPERASDFALSETLPMVVEVLGSVADT